MSGLCLERLALVGDAKDARVDLDALSCGPSIWAFCREGGGSDGVLVVDSTGGAVNGDVLRRLGADVSIADVDNRIFLIKS